MNTVDEVVAHNVRRIRTENGLSVAELAAILGVKPHMIYDFEGTRKEKPQRPFRWDEIFKLCFVLNTNLFELVLPPEGAERISYLPNIAETADRAGMRVLSSSLQHDARSELGWILFGLDGRKFDTAALEDLLNSQRQERDRRSAIIRGITEEMWSRLEEALNEMGDEA